MDDESWRRIEAEFRAKGFLAAGVEQFRSHIRGLMADWFELAERLNLLAQRMYLESSDLLPGRHVKDPIALGLQMMPRCLNGFQGAILLSERGLGVEAQALVRNVFETAFWLGYLTQNAADAVPRFERETLKSEIGLYEASLRHLVTMPPETRELVEEQLIDFRNHYASLPVPPRVEELANLSGYGPSYFFYKELSGAATHISMKSIHTFLAHNDEGDVVGHQIGPDEDNAGKAVWLGCRAIILAMDALQRLLGCADYEDELRHLNDEVEALKPYCIKG